MKQGVKVIALASLCMVCFSSGLMADSLVKEIKATLVKNIEVAKNYQKQTLKGAKGEVLYPIMYENRIYLPIKSVGEITDAEVTWDSANKRVNITPKVSVQYVQVPVQNTSSSKPSGGYTDLSTSDKKKVDDYKSQIDTINKKIDSYNTKLDALYKSERKAKDRYSSTGSKEDKADLEDIRDDIEYYEDAVKVYKKEILKLEDKIYDIYLNSN